MGITTKGNTEGFSSLREIKLRWVRGKLSIKFVKLI